MKNNIQLRGVATAQTPIMHIDGASGNKTYAIKTSIQVKDEAGDTQIKQIPYVQGSSYRGQLRDVMGDVVAKIIEEKGGKLDLATSMRLFSGGQMKKEGLITLDERREILERCPDLKLFGGIARTMFPSSIRFGMLYPIIQSTLDAGIVPADMAIHKQEESMIRNDKIVSLLDAWVIQRRNDETLEGQKIQYLSEAALVDAEQYIKEGLEKQEKRKENRKSGIKNETVKKSIQKHFAEIQVIPAGTKLFTELHLVEADAETTGLALLTLQSFLKNPHLASSHRSGYGKVSFNYDLVLEDGTTIKDFIFLKDDGSHGMKLDQWGQDCVDAFNQWGQSATADLLKVA